MRVKIIGTGFGQRVVAPTFRALGAEVEIFSPRDSEGIQRACASDADLISIHSPPFLHKQHVMWALDHRRAVLCDKPFGKDASEARAMRDHAREAGSLNFINFEFRLQPARVKLRELLSQGAIGKPQHLSDLMIGNGRIGRAHGWLFDAALGGGWIGAYGSHAIDMLRWLLDAEVTDCGAIRRTDIRERLDADGKQQLTTAEDGFTAWLRMDNGITASLDTASATSMTQPHRILVLGSEGALELIDDLSLILRRRGKDDELFEFPPPVSDIHEPALRPWLQHVLDAVRTGRPLAPSFDDGVAAAQVMERLRSSSIA
jgi:predicted dehydrogenase